MQLTIDVHKLLAWADLSYIALSQKKSYCPENGAISGVPSHP